MTMPPFEDDDVPTMKELHRTLRDFRDEFRSQMSMMVRKDVHTVEHDTLNTRVARLEAERDAAVKERNQTRTQYYLAVLGSGLSLTTALLVAWAK